MDEIIKYDINHPPPSATDRKQYEKLNSKAHEALALVRSSWRIFANSVEEIRERGLYRCKYPTWAKYCEAEFNYTGRYMNQLIESKNFAKALLDEGVPEEDLPEKELVIRAIKGPGMTMQDAAELMHVIRARMKMEGRSSSKAALKDVKDAQKEAGIDNEKLRRQQSREVVGRFRRISTDLYEFVVSWGDMDADSITELKEFLEVIADKAAKILESCPPEFNDPDPSYPIEWKRQWEKPDAPTPIEGEIVTLNIETAKLEDPYKGMSIQSIGTPRKWHLMRGQVSDAQADKGYPSLEAIHAAIDKMNPEGEPEKKKRTRKEKLPTIDFSKRNKAGER